MLKKIKNLIKKALKKPLFYIAKIILKNSAATYYAKKTLNSFPFVKNRLRRFTVNYGLIHGDIDEAREKIKIDLKLSELPPEVSKIYKDLCEAVKISEKK